MWFPTKGGQMELDKLETGPVKLLEDVCRGPGAFGVEDIAMTRNVSLCLFGLPALGLVALVLWGRPGVASLPSRYTSTFLPPPDALVPGCR